MLTVEELKAKVIKRGLISIETEEKEYARRGGRHGFELCRYLHTPQDFEQVLAERHRMEMRMSYDVSEENYWEYRWATLQINHVYERLKVLWGYPTLSSFAIIHVLELMSEPVEPV